LTGQPPDFWWQPRSLDMSRREPRWYSGHVDRWNRAVDPGMNWYSTRDAARLLGISVHRVRQLIHMGRLKSSGAVGKHFYIRGSDLLEFTGAAADVAPIPKPMEEDDERTADR
jgi:excisionase family DNA binding protein